MPKKNSYFSRQFKKKPLVLNRVFYHQHLSKNNIYKLDTGFEFLFLELELMKKKANCSVFNF